MTHNRMSGGGHAPGIFYNPPGNLFEDLTGPGLALGIDSQNTYESTTTRKAGGLDFRPEAGKTKAVSALTVAVVTGCIAPGLKTTNQTVKKGLKKDKSVCWEPTASDRPKARMGNSLENKPFIE